MPNRDITNKLNWILDNIAPPVIRDSKIIMSPLFRMAIGARYKTFMEFKETFHLLSDEEIDAYYESFKDSFIKRETDLSKESIKFILKHLKGKKILDAACGRGYLARKIVQIHQKEVFGVDLICDNVYKDEVQFKNGSLIQLPFEDAYFDTVICTHALEHIKNYDKALSELRRVTKNRLIIIVPRQREYKYTFDFHVNFFPYMYNFKRMINNTDAQFFLVENDFVCVEDKNQTRKERTAEAP